MNLSLDQSQIMLKNAARELVEREFPKEVLLELDANDLCHRPNLWEKLASVGWLGILIPREYGGEGSSLTDAAVLLQELGRGPVPGPYFSSAILGTLTMLEAGTEDQKRQILPGLATGQHILSLAITEADYGWGPQSVQIAAPLHDGNFTLNGSKVFVHDAGGATHFICAVRLDEQQIGLLLVDANSTGVSIEPLRGFTTGVFEVTLDNVTVPESSLLNAAGPENSWKSLERAFEKAIPVMCAYQIGGCEKVLEITLAYSNSRIQFGVPIGRFQRVQDHLIDMVNQADAAHWATYEALWKLDTGISSNGSVHMAKVLASEAYYQVCNSSHEVHAGVGIMREYGLPLHTKMSRTLYHYLGDPKYHKRCLAKVLTL